MSDKGAVKVIIISFDHILHVGAVLKNHIERKLHSLCVHRECKIIHKILV